MYTVCHSGSSDLTRKAYTTLLAFCFVSGILTGIAAVSCAGNLPFLLMHAASSPVSIVGLVLTAYFPLLISAAAVYYSRHWMLYVIAFVKAFLFSFSAYGALIAFGSAGWLLRFFLLFSDFLLLPVLIYFMHRQITGEGRMLKSDFAVCSTIAAAVCGIDFALISPFLASLIDIS